MKQMTRILVFSIIITPLVLSGQENLIPINISFYNEATAIPFTRFYTTPVHPGVQLGTEFNYDMKEHTRLFQAAGICYFYHKYLVQGVGLSTELGFEYRLSSGLAFTGLLGVGYMHTFATTQEFTFSNGQYEKRADKGNSRFYPSLSFDVGYYVRRNQTHSPKLFVRYQSWIEYPYSPGFIPVMTHANLHVGAKFFINSKFKKYD